MYTIDMTMIAESWRDAFSPNIYHKQPEFPDKKPQPPVLPNKRQDYVNPGNPLKAEIGGRKSITLKDLHGVW